MIEREIHGKVVAMVAWGEKADGSNDVAVFTGTADWDGKRLLLVREPKETSFEVPREWFARIQPVEPRLRPTLLGAEYSFSVSVGNLSEGEDVSGWERTGLRWPRPRVPG